MQPTLSGPGPHHFSHVLAVKLRTRMKRKIIRLSPSQVPLFYHRSVIEVDCYAGHRGEETPRRFVVDGRESRIVNVVARWTSPGFRYFEVQTEDGRFCVLRHDTVRERWECITS